MNINNKKREIQWGGFESNTCLFFLIVFLLSNILIFNQGVIPLVYIFSAILVLIIFFSIFTNNLERWSQPTNISRKVFWLSFTARLIVISILFPLYYYLSGTFFPPNAADATGYHYISMWMADDIMKGTFDLQFYLDMVNGDVSDLGYNYYVTLLYLIFAKSILVQGISNVILGSFTVVLIYKIVLKIFDEKVAAIAALICALQPYFLYYTAESLKETTMIFVLMIGVYNIVKFFNDKKGKVYSMIWIIIILLLLFFFRTVLAMSFLLGFMLHWMVTMGGAKKNKALNIFIGLLGIGLMYILLQKFKFSEDVIDTINTNDTQFESMVGRRSTGNSLVSSLASIPAFITLALPGPFPSFVYIPFQENSWYQISGAIIRNILCFYAFFGIIDMIKNNRAKHFGVLAIGIIYLIVVSVSGYATSHRMHLVALPFVMIYAANGIQITKRKYKKQFVLYLLILFVVYIIWNYFKLKGRE